VLAEVLALRSLFLNLSFRAGKEPMTEVGHRGLRRLAVRSAVCVAQRRPR
jgi:hypothetical protein